MKTRIVKLIGIALTLVTISVLLFSSSVTAKQPSFVVSSTETQKPIYIDGDIMNDTFNMMVPHAESIFNDQYVVKAYYVDGSWGTGYNYMVQQNLYNPVTGEGRFTLTIYYCITVSPALKAAALWTGTTAKFMCSVDGVYSTVTGIVSAKWRFLQGDGPFANCTGGGTRASTNLGQLVTATGTLEFK
jgi:hypothetical protein